LAQKISEDVIPYFFSTTFSLGFMTIQTWGLFVALGFLVGAGASAWLAKRRGLKPAVVWDALGLIILGAIVGARFFYVIFYEPSYYLIHPAEIFALWRGGLSMIGGLFGAAVVGFAFLKYKKLNFLQYVDVFVFGLPLGYFLGRIGCFLIHDHPGRPTDFFLGVQYPDGLIRHDLGLYHSLLGLVIFLLFVFLKTKKIPSGSLLVVFLFTYGAARFFLDFLRLGETTFFFLTPAQWVGGLMVLAAGVLWRRLHRANLKPSINLTPQGPTRPRPR
jgi:phosphatidylglycerol:prolipoprotein diacylglycerol transferase